MKFQEDEKYYLVLIVFSSVLIFAALVTNEMTMLLTRFISYASPILLVVAPKFNPLLRPRGLINGIICAFAIGYYFLSLQGSVDMLPYMASLALFG